MLQEEMSAMKDEYAGELTKLFHAFVQKTFIIFLCS